MTLIIAGLCSLDIQSNLFATTHQQRRGTKT
jgi:hypothetical protein